MIKGTTESGLDFEVDENKVNDMRVIDAMVEAEGGSLSAVSRLITLVFTPEMKAKIYEHVKTEDGRSPIQDVLQVVFEILKYNGETKN